MKRLDIQLNESTNQNSKVHKVVKPTNKKTLLEDMGTSILNSQMSPPMMYNEQEIITNLSIKVSCHKSALPGESFVRCQALHVGILEESGKIVSQVRQGGIH